MQIFRTGLVVALILGILTVVEWVAASAINGDTARVVVLGVGTILEAWLIAWYYMHVHRLWRSEEAH